MKASTKITRMRHLIILGTLIVSLLILNFNEVFTLEIHASLEKYGRDLPQEKYSLSSPSIKLIDFGSTYTSVIDEYTVIYFGFDLISANNKAAELLYQATRSNFLWDTDLSKLKKKISKESKSNRIQRAYELIMDGLFLLGLVHNQTALIYISPPEHFIPLCRQLHNSISVKAKRKFKRLTQQSVLDHLPQAYISRFNKYLLKDDTQYCSILYSGVLQLLLQQTNLDFIKLISYDKHQLINSSPYALTWADVSKITEDELTLILVDQAQKLSFIQSNSHIVEISKLYSKYYYGNQDRIISNKFSLFCRRSSKSKSTENTLDWKSYLTNGQYNSPMKSRQIKSIGANTNTNNLICLPRVILIGAQKGATGELARWLNGNWHLKRVNNGEVHYFDNLSKPKITKAFSKHVSILKTYLSDLDNDFNGKPFKFKNRRYTKVNISQLSNEIVNISDDYSRTEDYLRVIESRSGQQAFALSELLNETIPFEKTPAYFDKANPEDVIATGAQNIILILREPSKRLHSSFWHLCRRFPDRSCNKYEFRNWILTAFKNIREDSNTYDLNAVRSLAYGLYPSYLRRWISVCERNDVQLTILFTEEFQKSPFDIMRLLEDRLRLPNFPYNEIATKIDDKYWVLNKYSKAITEKTPKHYATLEEDKPMQRFLSVFYRRSKEELLQILNDNSKLLIGKTPDWLKE